MAKDRVRVSLKGKKYKNMDELFTKRLKLARKKYIDKLAPAMEKKIIDDHISRGVSPVKGAKNFPAYSESYKKAIKAGRYPTKTIRPVNLFLYGELWDSFFVKRMRDKGLVIGFSDIKAVWHNTGAGRLPKRRILPTGTNETFKPHILSFMKRMLTDIVKKAF